jgi:hypothetical protein
MMILSEKQKAGTDDNVNFAIHNAHVANETDL